MNWIYDLLYRVDPLLLLVGSFFVLVVLRIPIAVSMGLSALVTAVALDLNPNVVINNIYQGMDSFTLLAVPFFLLAGGIMNRGQITARLLELSHALVGHVRGALAHVNVLVSMLFAGISGSPAADAAGIGAIIIPAMVRAGYDRAFSVAVTAASATIGGIIPPSIPMVIYGAFGNVSIGALFLAGVIPGILVGLSQMFVVYLYARNRPELVGPPPEWRRIASAVKGAAAPLGMPILIVGGITMGVFTPTEASVVAVVYGLVLAMLVYRDPDLSLRKLPQVLSDSAVFYSLPLFAVANAMPLGWLIAFLEAPGAIVEFVSGFATSYLGVYASIVVLLLILGTFLSPPVIIIVFLPVIQGLGSLVGAHPIHLGIITVLCLGIGQITPPYGICLLIASEIGGVSVMRAFYTSLGLVGMFLLVIVLCIVFPEIVLFLPRLLMPEAVGSAL